MNEILTLPLMRLSQGHLNLLEQCPRKFQYTYLDQLASPMTLTQQQRVEWGSRFHLLMQQRELGLSMERPDDPEEAELQACIDRLIAAAPEIFESQTSSDSSDIFRQSEHRRTFVFQDYLLTVIYDLVILDQQRGHILDWKTYPRPGDRTQLGQNWQTRLYLFALAETSHLQPEQVSMTYWFVRSPTPDPDPQPESYQYEWSDRLHEQTRHDLTHLLTQLKQWLQAYEVGVSFPQVDLTVGLCPSCSYERRCQRHSDSSDLADYPLVHPRLEEVEEVRL